MTFVDTPTLPIVQVNQKLAAYKGKLRKVLEEWACARSTVSLEDALTALWEREDAARETEMLNLKEKHQKEIEGWETYKASIDSALNSGDGSYRP